MIRKFIYKQLLSAYENCIELVDEKYQLKIERNKLRKELVDAHRLIEFKDE